MEDLILIKYGELWLKTTPVRRRFEKILKRNIKAELKKSKDSVVIRTKNGRVLIYPTKKINVKFLARTFGITAYANAVEINKNIEEIKKVAEKFVVKKKPFVIRARRSDKSFPLTSQEIQQVVGMHLEKLGYKADIKNAKHKVEIEIRDNAYVYANTTKGPGGLPVGSGGVVIAKLRDKDDLLSAWLVTKRGIDCVFLRPKKELLTIVKKWNVGRKIRSVASKEAAMEESKTLVDCRETKNNSNGFLILNPIVGFGKKEKQLYLKKIGAGGRI